MEMIVKILKIEDLTPDVKRFIVEKPEKFDFISGQAAHISINKDGMRDKVRPFTFTCVSEDENLEFIIKKYEEHNGVTKQIHELVVGDELILKDVFGAIRYKGKGVFIAGGTGITPFISIFRDLNKRQELKGNKLIFSNKTNKDIILEDELKSMFGSDLILTLTNENKEGYHNSRIDENFLKENIKDFNEKFYLCGPPKMVVDLKVALNSLGVDFSEVVFEE